MKADNNEEQNEKALNSIRRKYKGRPGRKKINSAISEEELIKQGQSLLNEESNNVRTLAMSLPFESYSKITKTKTVFEDGDKGNSRTQQIVINKSAMNESSYNKNNSRVNEEKGKIVSIKSVSTNLYNANTNNNINESQGKNSSRVNISRNSSQGKIVEIKQEINSGQSQRQRDSRKESREKADIHQRISSNIEGRSSRKNIIKQVDTYQRNTNGDSRNSRKNIINQVDTYQRQNNRGSRDSRNSRKDTSNQRETYQEQSYRNSRNGSQNSKNHVIKESTSTTSINRRSGGNTNETTTKIIQNYTFYQDQKSKTMSNMGYHPSNNNKINVKEYESNRRSSRNSSSSITKNNEKNGSNTIKVNKVLITNKENNTKKIYNIKTTPIMISNKNNSNATSTNNYKKINNQYDTNTNRVNKANISIASKLALNELKPKEINPYATMKNFFRKDNLSFHVINESKKKEKKPYVLHVRKLERISSNSQLRRSYYNEKEPIIDNNNYKSVIVKTVSKDKNNLKNNLTNKKSSENKLNNIFMVNTAKKDIKESGKEIKKQIYVNPRKNDIKKSDNIQSNTKMRMSYNSNSSNNNIKKNNSFVNDIHHKILSVKNVSEDDDNIINEKDVANRMNYLHDIFKINSGKKELNESQRIKQIKVYDTQRKNDIIKSGKVQANSQMRMSYNNDIRQKDQGGNEIHHKILSVKNVSEEEDNLINEENLANRMSYINKIFKINTTEKNEQNERQKLIKSQVYDTNRKNVITKPENIQSNSKMRTSYNNNNSNNSNHHIKNYNSFTNDIHHKILSVKNISEEDNLINEENLANRMNYINKIFKINTENKALYEKQKLAKTQIYDTNTNNNSNRINNMKKDSIQSNSNMRMSYNSNNSNHHIKNYNSFTNDIHHKILSVKNVSEEDNIISEKDVANRLNYLHNIFKINTGTKEQYENSHRKNESMRGLASNNSESKGTTIISSNRRSNRKILSSGDLGSDSKNFRVEKTQIIKYGRRSNSRGNSRSNSISNYENINEGTFTTTKHIRRTASEVELGQRRREKKI